MIYSIQKEIDKPHMDKRIGVDSSCDSYGTGTSNTGQCKVPKPACVHILKTSMLVMSIFVIIIIIIIIIILFLFLFELVLGL